jgi:hypothetical protein
MTTKRARSRRLVRSENDLGWYCPAASSGDRSTHTAPSFYQIGRGKHQTTAASLWENHAFDRIIRARTRLALHDAILRAGWPSPWTEL